MSIENPFNNSVNNNELVSDPRIAGKKTPEKQQEDIEKGNEKRNELLEKNDIKILSLKQMYDLGETDYTAYQLEMKNKILTAMDLPDNSDVRIVFDQALGTLNYTYLEIKKMLGKE